MPIHLLTIYSSLPSRRFVWRHLDSIREGRVILLTTHAMEEADLLADEVAILRTGELAAIGSPLELKSEHGTALQFSILVNDKDLPFVLAKFWSCLNHDLFSGFAV